MNIPLSKRLVRRPLPENLPEGLSNLHPVLQRVYAARGVTHTQALERHLALLLPYHQLLGIDSAVDCLAEALQTQARIVIVGDFDADGATSTAVAVRALRAMGAQDVHYIVPNRFTYGYGLTPEIVEVAAALKPALIITVDNGISSVAGVARAKALGIRVLITDHHLPGDTLPDADAIVNPNQPHDHFPSKHLAGVGVIFYVMLALRARLRTQGWFADTPEPNLANLLDLVALGTVADVVVLDSNNRILVHQGLARIQAGECCAGILALLKVAGRAHASLTTTDLGFAVGPRLNAAGRLEDMSQGIACLLADDFTEALTLAERLNALNQERRAIEETMCEQADAQLKQPELQLSNGELPAGLCLWDASWHQGVIGILAGRLKERWHRPVICFARVNESELKGSARSIPGVHIRDTLDAIAKRSPELITKFGGHAMAAGLSIHSDHFPAFSVAFAEEVAKQVHPTDLQGILISDGALAATEMSLPLAELLRTAGPWGQGFAEPLFDGEFEVISQRIVGEKHIKFVLGVGDVCVDAIAFHVDRTVWPTPATRLLAAYRLAVNVFRGERQLQLMLEHLMPISMEAN